MLALALLLLRCFDDVMTKNEGKVLTDRYSWKRGKRRAEGKCEQEVDGPTDIPFIVVTKESQSSFKLPDARDSWLPLPLTFVGLQCSASMVCACV